MIEKIDSELKAIHDNLALWMNEKVLKDCLGMLDLTSLKPTDTYFGIQKFTEKVNGFNESFPEYPLPASICVFPNFAKTVKESLKVPGVHVTVVSGCFPASQSFLEVKLLESKLAVEQGADEVDIVLALNSFLDRNLKVCSEEISAIKREIGDKTLKVILETGALADPGKICEASFLAMEAGADFIKTSTGKIEPAATPFAAIVMCNCIRQFYKDTGKKVGFKPAGGMTVAKDVAVYYGITSTILGEEWLNPALLRFGASRVANSLLSEIQKSTINYY